MDNKENEFCVWRNDGKSNVWHTDCEKTHIFFDDTPAENGYRFCPYCGKPLKEADDEAAL